MKRILGIVVPGDILFDESSLITGCGGSETWAIQLSQEISSRGIHVIVFCNCSSWHFDNKGVEWVPISTFNNRIQYQKFDWIILSRFYEGFITSIEQSNCCENIFIQSHDWGIGPFDFDKFEYPQYNDTPELHSKLIKAIVNLSEWHLDCMHDWVGLPKDNMIIIPNGIDPSLFPDFDDLPITRDHRILWSSRHERGLNILINHLLPVIKTKIPDFGVDICSYDQIPSELLESPDVGWLGKLSKHQLYSEMQKHAVWFYPSVYPETFNITSLEAALCGNNMVIPYIHGMATTFKPFVNLGMTNLFPGNYTIGDMESAIMESAEMIISYILNYDLNSHIKIRKMLYNHVKNNYTWSNAADKWINLFKNFNN